MATVSEGHSVSVQSSSHTDDLMAHADTKDGLIPLGNSAAEDQGSLHALLWVSRSVGKEKSVELVPDGVEVKVPREDGDGSVAADESTEDVGLGTKVEKRDLDASVGVQLVGLLGGDLVDKIFKGGVPVFLLSGGGKHGVGADGEATEGGTLVTEESCDGTGVDASDTGDIVAFAPRGDGLDAGVMRGLVRDVLDDDGSALDALGLKDDTDVLGIERCDVVGNTIVSNHGSSEDENLAAV